MMEDLRQRAGCALSRCPVELLVLEAVVRPWVALALVEVVRGVYPSLPIILCTGSDPDVREEAKRLAVQVVFEELPDEEQLRRRRSTSRRSCQTWTADRSTDPGRGVVTPPAHQVVRRTV
jgi:hypothetical protein